MKERILHRTKALWYLLPMLALFLGLSMASQAMEQDTTECQATVVTDKDDYAPGEVAHISGTNWLPGETVDIMILSTNLQAFDYYTVVADSLGNFSGLEYDILEKHLGEQFELEAVGLTSGCKAVWYFTDANVQFNTSGLPSNTQVTVEYSGPTTGSVELPMTGNIALTGDYTFSYTPVNVIDGSNIYVLSGASYTRQGTTTNLTGTTNPFNVYIPSTGGFTITGIYTLQSGAEGSIASVSIGTQSSSVVYGT